MAEKFITHNVYLEVADFNVLILEFPDEDVNDKLALLAREKGLIYRQYYEDFTLGTCLANSSPFFYHLHMRQSLMEKYEEIRAETLAAALRFNGGMRPENVFINANNVLKTKSTVKEGEQVRPLVENDLWDQEPPLSDFGPALIGSAPIKEDDDNPFQDDDATGPPDMGAPMSPDNPYADNTGGGGDSKGDSGDVPYELISYRWDKLGLLINIKKFEESEENLVSLVGGSPFETTSGYHLLIVQLCIDDFSDVFHLLDTVGVSNNVPPNQLMEELYKIAIEINPFLKLEDVDLVEIKKQHKKLNASKNKNNRRMSAAASPERIINKKRKKRFADISKKDLLSLSDQLKKHVVGQDPALQNIADAIQRASVGLKRPHEPLGVFMFTGNTGVGKCLAPGTEVIMYEGSIKTVEEVTPGDLLMGPDSLPRQVLNTCSGEDEMFEISPVKGKPWACNAPHVLTLIHTTTGEIIDVPLNEYLEKHKTFKHLYKLFRVPVNFGSEQSGLLDPYFVGLWLGDGRKDLSGVQIANTDKEIISYLADVADRYNLQLTNYEKRDGFCPAWALTAGNVGGKGNALLSGLRKAITVDFSLEQPYKTASEKERLALLAGFIDADGSLVHNCYEITQKNPQIAKDLAFVARSLGFMVTESVREINGVSYQRLFISGDTHRVPVRIKHKKATPRGQIKNVLRTGFSVKSVGRGQYYGFTLSGDGRFLLGDFTVTHNTETAKVLAEVLEATLVRIDCSEYQHAHEVAKLTGSPPGYVGYEDGGHLVKEVAKNPFAIVLLDEIEKAHSHFHERVLQIIDDGILTDNKGKKISFRETMIIMTSNIGVREVSSIGKTVGFGDVGEASEDRTVKAREEALKKKFKPEFLNRIDDIVHFKKLERDDYMHILDILLAEVQEQLEKSQQMKLNFNVGAKNFLLDKGIDKKFGARPIRRAIKTYLNTPLAVSILKDEVNNTSRVVVSLRPDKTGLVFRQVSKRVKEKKEAGE